MSFRWFKLTRATVAWAAVCAALTCGGLAQKLSTTTEQGTVYFANGSPGSGTLQVRWPAFTTASNQAVAAGKLSANIGADGFVSVNLAANLGSSPAGLYYTAIYHLSDGTTSTEYWPGDALEINAYSAGLNAQVIVRTVKLTYHASLPDLVRYEISFANDWAEDLAIKTSSAVPYDVWMPVPVSPAYAPNLSGVTVLTMSGGSVTIDAGTTAPTRNRNENHRRDNCFIPGSDSDLV